MTSPSPVDAQRNRQKKPRHRHSPAQLAALNELYGRDEHPALDLRSSLAERLGMETKTVNAWFQNKRASSRKKNRGALYDIPSANSLTGSTPASTSNNTPLHHPEFDDYHAEQYCPIDQQPSFSPSTAPPEQSHTPSNLYTDNPDHIHFLSETDSMPRRMRMRPSALQTDELRKLYDINPHPTTDQRQVLAERIGMRYQSITNWFQNQRSLAKKRKEDEIDGIPSITMSSTAENHSEQRTYSAFPPPSEQPSLGLSTHPGHSSAPVSRARRSPSISSSLGWRSPRRPSSRRSTTPYNSSMPSFSRTRRSRPEPHQLNALKDLFTKTSTPTIDERLALALEVDMDINKVTNWFRNLRQTARKRVKRSGSAEDDGFDDPTYSTSVSRSETPSFRSYSPSSSMDLDEDHNNMQEVHSDAGSEDDYQEAVTPPPEPVPVVPPIPSTSNPPSSSSRISISQLTLSIDPASYAELEKVSATQYSGVKVEDALLLLSFHHHYIVH